MEWFLVSGYSAICVAVFTLLRIPLNRWTLPSASIGGAVLIFALVQMLNFYHPYSGSSRQHLDSATIMPGAEGQHTDPPMPGAENRLVAWFSPNNLLRLNDGSAVEVTFDSIPGKVFSGRVRMNLPLSEAAKPESQVLPSASGQSKIPVLIDITDPRYAVYQSRLPAGSQARTAVYGEKMRQLALVRKTLLRMSAWMNYLSFHA